MKFPPEYQSFLQGKDFDGDLRFRLIREDDDVKYRSRRDVLADLARGRKVIHVGCVDHTPEKIESKRKSGKWLHEILFEAASRCLGVDLAEEGVRYMKEKLGYDDALAADILVSKDPRLFEESWDYIIIGEVLEHMDAPIAFLKGLAKRFGKNARSVIITVPNAFSRENFKYAKKGVERINSDHRYWYTPYTLARAVVLAGMTPRRLVMCRHGDVKEGVLRNRRMKKHPFLRNTVLLTADFSQ